MRFIGMRYVVDTEQVSSRYILHVYDKKRGRSSTLGVRAGLVSKLECYSVLDEYSEIDKAIRKLIWWSRAKDFARGVFRT